MTTTIPTPITLDTSCPSWCTAHRWDSGEEGVAALHQAATVTLIYPPAENATKPREFTVAAYRFVSADEPLENHVYFQDRGDGMLMTGAEVGELADALLIAGRLAFQDQPVEPRRIPEDAVPVGPCPPWCELPDGHPWNECDVLASGDYGRTHELHIGEVEVLWTEVPGSLDRPPTIGVECLDLTSPADADKLAEDLRKATRLAFGDR